MTKNTLKTSISMIKRFNSVAIYRLGGVMGSVLALSEEVRGFYHRSGQTKDICCFSAKNAALKTKSKEWLAQSQDNVAG